MHISTHSGRTAGTGAHGNNRLPTTTDQAVGKRIRSLRRAAGMTLRDLGEAVGVSGVQFQRYETGASRVATSRLVAICEVLGVQVDTLIDEAVSTKTARMSDDHRAEGAELARAFNAITDPTHRNAIIALARAFAASPVNPAARGELDQPAAEAEGLAKSEESIPPAADANDHSVQYRK